MTARLTARGLGFAYHRDQERIFDSLDVDAPSGALTVLTGPSGSGKSTLLYVLATLLRPSRGQVYWDGAPLDGRRDADRAAWRAATSGFVFQDAMLDPARTVLDNVCEPALFAGVPRRAARRRALELLDELLVADRADHRPGEVSGGQAQRVALCRALVTDPEVIFGDEPTGNLDDASADVVWSVLTTRAAAGATIVVATHDSDRAATADVRVAL